MGLFIKNGKILLGENFEIKDIFIKDGKIKDIGIFSTGKNDRVIDANSNYVLPGFIDIHTHIDDKIGNYYLADNYSTASRRAIETGITTLYTFITETPNDNLTTQIKTAVQKAKSSTYCDYFWHITPIHFDTKSSEKIIKLINKGFRTIKLYTTYKSANIYSSYSDIEKIFELLKDYDVTYLIHAEDNDIIEFCETKSYDFSKAFTHSLLRPKEAEVIAVKKIIEINKKYKNKIHFVHISTPEAAKYIYEMKSQMPVTCETCPQYFYLSDKLLKTKYGHRYIFSPPLRDVKNVNKIKSLSKKGYFDLFATDHCAFNKNDKDVILNATEKDIRKVPNGIAGIGSLVANVFNLFSPINEKKLISITKHLSENPAKMLGIYPKKGSVHIGADADLIIIDFSKKLYKVKSSYSDTYEPYPELKTNLIVRNVFLRGELIVENGNVTNTKTPKGKPIWKI